MDQKIRAGRDLHDQIIQYCKIAGWPTKAGFWTPVLGLEPGSAVYYITLQAY